MWAETYVMQAASGRRKAVSTDIKLLDEITTASAYWDKLDFNCARTANLCSLHIFKAGIRPQYDDPQNASGGHFKMKPFTVDAAHVTLRLLSMALIDGDFPNSDAVNGVTIAKKAKSSLIKVWVADSLDLPVIAALAAWFDDRVDHLCGRRLFSPHKYILKTFSRQQAQERLSSEQSGSLMDAGSDRALSFTFATPSSAPGSPLSGNPPASLPDPRTRLAIPVRALNVTYAVPSLEAVASANSDCALSGFSSPTTDPHSSRAPSLAGPLMPAPSVTYAASLDHLMYCSRSDPAWSEFTAAAVSARLETTIRKCGSWGPTVGSHDSTATLTGDFFTPAPSLRLPSDSDIYG